MKTLLSYSEDWKDLIDTDPKLFVAEFERRYDLPEDFRKVLNGIKRGMKAKDIYRFDRKHRKHGKYGPDDWIIEPYSPYGIRNIWKSIQKRGLEERVG